MIFRVRIPNFVEAKHPGDVEFHTKRELMLLYGVKGRWVDGDRFHQFSLCDSGYLMLEYDKGHEWWALGQIFGTPEELASLNFPRWETPDMKKLRKDVAGEGDFDVKQNQDTGLWEIWHRKKNRKIGACMDKKNVEALIEGYLKGEEACG